MSFPSKSKSFIRKPLDHTIHFAARFGATYFITMCCNERGRNQLCHNGAAQIIFETAKIYDRRGIWYLELILLMPDHLHALIAIHREASLSKIISDFKRATTKFAGLRWQRNFFDHRLRHDESLEQKAVYIVNNPKRAGLIQNPEDWPYLLDRAGLDVAAR